MVELHLLVSIMQQILILSSSVLVFVTYIVYAWSIVTKRTKPHRTTRLVLFLVTALGAASLFAQHDSVAIWLIGTCSLASAFVFLLSIKYGIGGWSKVDLVCLIIALIGIIVWRVTNNPLLALYASIMADFAGMIPTLIKTYRLPKSEYWFSYVSLIIAISLTLLAVKDWEAQCFAYPLYLFIINIIMLSLILRPRFSNRSFLKGA